MSVLVALSLGAGPRPEAPIDLRALLANAEKVQKADIAAWARFRFHRHHRKEHMAADGRVSETKDLKFVVTPTAGGFDERLVQVDGRAPTPEEVKEARKEAKFSRHYSTLLSGEPEGDDEEAYSLGLLFRLASYKLAGRQRIDGVMCYRVDFSPDPAKDTDGIAGRFAEAMKGSLWVTMDGLHLLRARARTMRPISIALSLAKVHELEVSLDSQPVAPGVYLPRQITVRTSSRVLVGSSRQRNVYRYSKFTPV